MSLLNEDSGLMNRFGLESFLLYSSLETFIQKFVDGQTEYVIELEFFIGEETITVHSVKKGSSLEQSTGVLFFKSEKFSGSLTEMREEEMNSPYLTLVSQTILADQLQFVVDSFLFEGTTRSTEGC